MTVYPNQIDSDADIGRVDDNITEIGGEIINQLRSAVFALEEELGITPSGTAGSVSNRLDTSLNPDGTIKAIALNGVGLVSLPIANVHVGPNAAIDETKLNLDHKTSDLYTSITAASSLLAIYINKTDALISDIHAHLSGASTLSDNGPGKHILSHILLNQHPVDSRDVSYTWGGLKDKNQNLRPATHAMAALDEINTDLVNHENSTSEAHVAAAIKVDTTAFIEIPETSTDAQKVFNYLDQAEVLNMGLHRAVEHVNCIPRSARSQKINDPNAQSTVVVTETPVTTYLVHTPPSPNDSITTGDDIIKFTPILATLLDSQFVLVKPGDIIRVNYSNGLHAQFPIVSIKYIPGNSWYVRIDGVNLCEGSGTATITRPAYDDNVFGVLAPAYANPIPSINYSNILPSLILGHPRGATALGIGFDPNQLDSNHYKLYLELYPTGDPAIKVIKLPAIDVTGNLGKTPGLYTIESVVDSINSSFRKIGYNYRFIAFSHQGQLGIMLADAISNASFAIVAGENNNGVLNTNSYNGNVVGGNNITTDDFDALGFGPNKSNIAGPAFSNAQYSSTSGAQLPTKVINPLSKRHYIVNGRRRDDFAPTYLANSDGYWSASISAINFVGTASVEVEYLVDLDLAPAGLKSGKTIVVQPVVDFNNSLYSNIDYGRFIIKSVIFSGPCDGYAATTKITVINGVHATGDGYSSATGGVGLPVKLFFSQDSVGFDLENLVDISPTIQAYSRYHEIFINNEGKTFSYERARMPKQSGSSTLLDTSRWHLISVSPKLRGYRTSDPLVFNKYVRLSVLTYDNASGEFTVKLGQVGTTPTGVLRPGSIITAKKNVPFKVYDETNVDYLEFKFIDDLSPGATIGENKIVDIEIFPSLFNDNEIMPVASCEVCWPPVLGSKVIQNLKDLRQFGSTGEINFTESAEHFINAGDRELHQNGIIRGYDFDSISSTNPLEAYFKGGSALVNGKIVNSNNTNVVIPKIYQYGSSVPSTYNWAICVNESGLLEPVLITNSKIEFFATTGISGIDEYYLPSYTFSELINTRKDLTPIYIAAETFNGAFVAASMTLSDVRKYIYSETSNTSLVLAAPGEIGNFYSFEALKNYTNKYSSGFNVKLKGNFVILNSGETVNLTEFNNQIIFDGTESTITVNAGRGFVLNNNITFKNCNFIYNPSLISYTAGDNINNGNGCLYSDTDLENVTIENCNFSCSLVGTQRPPFININLATNGVANKINIKHNKFIDSGVVSFQSAIAIIDNGTGGSTNPATLSNCIIYNNVCNKQQNICLTSTSIVSEVVDDVTTTTLGRPGLSCINVEISNNTCGSIGYVISSAKSSNPKIYGLSSNSELVIKNNSVILIASLNARAKNIISYDSLYVVNYGTGNAIIEGNSAKWIQVLSSDCTSENEKSSSIITNNTCKAYLASQLSNYVIDSYTNSAIIVANSSESGSSKILSNQILSENYTYDYGISACQSSVIENNTIKRVTKNLIVIYSSINGPNTFVYNICNNYLYRIDYSILSYISLPAASTYNKGTIANNFFDKDTIDGSVLTLISGAVYQWNTYNNINYFSYDLIAMNNSNVKIKTINFYVDSNNISATNAIITLSPAITLNLNSNTEVNNTINFNQLATAKNGLTINGAGQFNCNRDAVFFETTDFVGTTVLAGSPRMGSLMNWRFVELGGNSYANPGSPTVGPAGGPTDKQGYIVGPNTTYDGDYFKLKDSLVNPADTQYIYIKNPSVSVPIGYCNKITFFRGNSSTQGTIEIYRHYDNSHIATFKDAIAGPLPHYLELLLVNNRWIVSQYTALSVSPVIELDIAY